MKYSIFKSILFILMLSTPVLAQDDIVSMLNAETKEPPQPVAATFKGTRLINGHSVETRKKGNMDFIISHRFGKLNSGSYELYGLDQSNIRLGFEFALTNSLTVAIGRNSFEKTYDGYLKYRVIRQKTSGSPVSVTAFSSTALKTLKDATFSEQLKLEDRLAYTHQVLIARKFNPNLSVQLMPSLVHFNSLYPEQLNHDLYAMGIGGRIKVSKRMSINAEYYYRFNELERGTFNSVAIGIDIETGGHIFQLQFTNSRSMIEKGFISEIKNDFFAGDIHFGFNVSRSFQISH